MRKMCKDNKGITLIALVITIIVLLILAGVTIATLVGDNGILRKAQEAKENTENATLKENQILAEIESAANGEQLKVTDETPGELSGSGTTEDPFKIESVEDLVAFLDNITNGNNYSGQTVELATSLDLASANAYVDGNSTTFGDYNGDGQTKGLYDEINDKNYTGLKQGCYNFEGILNGNNKDIKNIYTKVSNQYDEIGFIGNNRGTIKDLTLSGEYRFVDMKNHIDVGIIVGENRGQLINCSSRIQTTVSLTNIEQSVEETMLFIGGIAGENYEGGTINNCKNYGTMSIELSFNLTDANNYRLTRVGGIVGSNNSKIINSVNHAGVILTDTRLGESNTRGGMNLAGISGTNAADGIIINVINYGKITGTGGDDINIGGIVGENKPTAQKLQNVYNKGIVEGTAPVSQLKIGGIVGDRETIIDRVYNVGNVVANSETKYIGGIIGDVHANPNITNSKYLSSTATGAAQGEERDGVDRVDSLSAEEVKNLLNQGVQELSSTISDLIEWTSVQ